MIDAENQAKRWRLKSSDYGDLETVVYVRLREMRSQKDCVDGNLPRERALEW